MRNRRAGLWWLWLVALFIAIAALAWWRGWPPFPPRPGFATVEVRGTGETLFDVYDSTGRQRIDAAYTGRRITLASGSYRLVVNGSRRDLRVRPGQSLAVALGTVVVSGTGKDRYEVQEVDSPRAIRSAPTGKSLELLPGPYALVLHGRREILTLREDDTALFGTGILTVPGDGRIPFEVYDAGGTNRLVTRPTGVEIELFPGPYPVRCRGRTIAVTVSPGRTTAVPFP